MVMLTETRQRRKPSETACPATVAIIEALCPEANKDIANSSAAADKRNQESLKIFRKRRKKHTFPHILEDYIVCIK
jgi:hypothetical protein